MLPVTVLMLVMSMITISVKAVHNECNLGAIGRDIENFKVLGHSYHLLYCKVLMPFVKEIQNRPIRLLEIGFGCGHHNHGNSALLWNKFFTSNGAKLDQYGIDLHNVNHIKCAKQFLTLYPPGSIVKDIFLGDQSDRVFMEGVIAQTGGKFDIIVDDGGHMGDQIRNSFEVLWPELENGGIYVIESLGMIPSKEMNDSFVRDILGWQDQLIGVNYNFPDSTDVGWTKFPSKKPNDLVEIHCRNQICALFKE